MLVVPPPPPRLPPPLCGAFPTVPVPRACAQLPVAADYGERSSVSVSGMWWGSAPLDQAGTSAINRLVHAAVKQAARPQAASTSDPCKVHVGGVPSNAREDTLLTHFAAFEPQKVSVSDWTRAASAQLGLLVGWLPLKGLHIAALVSGPAPTSRCLDARSSRRARASLSSRLPPRSWPSGPSTLPRRCRSTATRLRWSCPRPGRGDRLNPEIACRA